MIEATIGVNLGESWIRDIVIKHPITIKFLGWMPSRDHRGGKSLIEIKGSKPTLDTVSEALKENPFICHIQLSKSGKQSILGEVEVNSCAICRAIVGTDCFLTSGTTTDGGDLLLTIVSSDRSEIKKFIDSLEKDDCRVEVLSIRDSEKDELLTERQEEVLRKAYEMGYFEYPKRITIKDLSKALDMSISTLSEMLRKGEKKILEYYLSGK